MNILNQLYFREHYKPQPQDDHRIPSSDPSTISTPTISMKFFVCLGDVYQLTNYHEFSIGFMFYVKTDWCYHSRVKKKKIEILYCVSANCRKYLFEFVKTNLPNDCFGSVASSFKNFKKVTGCIFD